jgi:protein ImuA
MLARTLPPPDHSATLARLRARLAQLDHTAKGRAALPLAPEINHHLPWGGLPLAGLHELLSDAPGHATGFAALLLARAQARLARRAALWIAAEPDAYLPGLAGLGLDATRLFLLRAPRPRDALWAAEEALRSPATAAVLLLGARALDMTAARRLQLAAEAGGGIALLLREEASTAGPTAALTRWRIAPRAVAATPHHLGPPAWEVSLLRARGGQPGTWLLEWDAATGQITTQAATPTAERRRA